MGKLEHGGDVPSLPLISVVMPTHDALPYLDESIESILSQTFREFEFVILDDASTDGTTDALNEWAKKDSRIRLHRSERNLGLSASSNLVVSLSRAPLIARMDADDVSAPERLMRQWEVMRAQPDVALVGTLCDGIDAVGRFVRPRDRWRLVRRSMFPPFPHGSVMFSRRAFDEIGGYSEGCVGGEDRDLFLRISRGRRVVVLPDVLYHYRYHVKNSSLSFFTARVEGSEVLRRCDDDETSLEGKKSDKDARLLDLRSFRYAGSLRLWAGKRPEALGPLLARGSLRWNAETVATLIWACWARLSPGTLRVCLRLFIRARDLLASSRLRDGRACEWQFE
jgi:glycosyltransferase involved in cell wall biosynthesis